jgi:hypothetical protein
VSIGEPVRAVMIRAAYPTAGGNETGAVTGFCPRPLSRGRAEQLVELVDRGGEM